MNKSCSKGLLLAVVLMIAINIESKAQDSSRDYQNFPLVVTLQFHAFALPFHDFASNFKNVGIGLGTEVSLNEKDNWAQQFNVIWFRNKNLGNGLLLYTQSAWRPTIASEVYTELKIGAGYLYSFHPVTSFEQTNGEWNEVKHSGKWMFTIPIGVSLGYHNYSSGTQVSPFITYQFLPVKNYNASIPIVPETLFQIGSRIHSK
ncbi:MAG: hypothetical protein AB7O48_07415 [Cyclobacteriaceae bacterium]